MDCGVPFCHTGCPLNNIIPDWNDLVYRGRWQEAVRQLACHEQLPGIHGPHLSRAVRSGVRAGDQRAAGHDQADREDHHRSRVRGRLDRAGAAASQTGKRVAVIGSGPAGLAAAQQLARAGHAVTVFEKADRIGGLLRYGIPNFKMEKHLIDRRIGADGGRGREVRDRTRTWAGTLPVEDLRREFDAILLAGGAEQPRDLQCPGRELKGIHFAMDFLPQQNRREATGCGADATRFWRPASAW